MSNIIISNSTPIILLHKIGQLGLLKRLYGEIYITEAVYKEVIIDATDKISSDFILQNKWINIVKIKDFNAKRMFATSLHEGEVETMILAMEMNAGLCILDDLLARKYARNFRLDITGTLGILVESKKKGYINEIKIHIDKLKEIGMYMDDKLYYLVLAKAGDE